MISVKLHKNGTTQTVSAVNGDNLLKIIQQVNTDFYAPCGGNGTCGKCRVNIPGEGFVTSCLYSVERDIDVVLPDNLEMKILSSQYECSKEIDLNTGNAAELSDNPFGIAIDIGTTTIVYYFMDMKTGGITDIRSKINPQLKYGSDVISRINYSSENNNGVSELKNILIDNINLVIDEFCNKQKFQRDDIVRLTVVGNTVMLHSLLGVSALSIALAPFTPTFTDTKNLPAKTLGINVNSGSSIVVAPSLSGYVGGDIVAGLASLHNDFYKKQFLFVDIGTNGEMALITRDRILTCATAAGPAFEGANISCGMSATQGAISSFNIGTVKTIGDIEPTGICGSGLIDIVAHMLNESILSTDGNIDNDFVIPEINPESEIKITQQDIREVQLAKSAIAAGINRLLSIAEVSLDELDNILLAGGFGNYIDIKNAIRIGLLPDVDLNRYIQMGNTAGNGAVLTLKSDNFITQVEELKEKMEYIELSNDAGFSMEYAMNMFFS